MKLTKNILLKKGFGSGILLEYEVFSSDTLEKFILNLKLKSENGPVRLDYCNLLFLELLPPFDLLKYAQFAVSSFHYNNDFSQRSQMWLKRLEISLMPEQGEEFIRVSAASAVEYAIESELSHLTKDYGGASSKFYYAVRNSIRKNALIKIIDFGLSLLKENPD